MPQPLHILTTPSLILAGRNKTFPVGPSPGIKDLWQVFMTDFGKINGQVGMNAYGVCHSFGGGMMDYLCAVEVKDAGQVPGYMYTVTNPARRTAVFLHKRPLEKISEAWKKIFDEWLPAAKLEVAQGPQFEVYGEAFNMGEEKIEIFIPVK